MDRLEKDLKKMILIKQSGNYGEAARILLEIVHRYKDEDQGRYYEIIGYYMGLLDFLLHGDAKRTEDSITQEAILDYYYSMPYEEIAEELYEPLFLFTKGMITYFPYIKLLEYMGDVEIILGFDPIKQMHFVNHENRKLYFFQSDPAEIHEKYVQLVTEQHEDSPHRYRTDVFDVKEGDTVLDVGAAEAIFSLEVIEKCKNMYIFEPLPMWQQALANTFEPWQEKVTIVPSLVSEGESEITTTIDKVVGEAAVDFIKIDVEGYELAVLKGARQTLLRNPHIKIVVCTYHNMEDAEILKGYLEELGFTIEFSKGYMYFPGEQRPPYFRRGLIRAMRK